MTAPLLEILAYEETPLGPLCLRRRELLSDPGTIVTEITLNHAFLMSSLHTDSERVLAEMACELHGGENLKVLIGGLGLGHTAHAALSSQSVADVNVIELLPEVIDWMQRGLVPLAKKLNGDDRLHIIHNDVYDFLSRTPSEQYDLILIDVDHSPDDNLAEENLSFYTEAGLQASRQHLATDGVLAIWSYAESSPFADALRTVFENVTVEPVTYFNRHVREEFTDWLFFAKN